MAPKRVTVANSSRPQKSFLSTVYDEATNPENATIVRSLLVFGAGVAFLHSSLGELLLPPPPIAATSQSTSAPTNLWTEALGFLSDEEREVLSRSGATGQIDDPHLIIQYVQDKQKICEDKRWRFQQFNRTIELKEIADKVLSWLQKFIVAGDIAVNVDPLHAGLPWAGIRLLAQAATAGREQMQALLRGLDRVLCVMYRCQLYELLLTANETSTQARHNLRQALIKLYSKILKFLATAILIYEKNSVRRAFAAWTSDDLLRFEKDCQELESGAELAASVTSTWGLLQENRAAEILAWVSDIPYEDHHKAACKNRIKNTGGWIFKDKRYKQWYESQDSAILWLHGILGAGKTKLVSRVIDRIQDDHPQTALGYFYCNRNEESRREPTRILQSYVQQFSVSPQQGAVPQPLIDIYERNRRRGGSSARLSLEESEDLLLTIIKAYDKAVLILDGLDESYQEERAEFIEVLHRLISQSANLKILISSRCDDNIKRQLELKPNIGIEATDNRDDIRKFVRERLRIMDTRRRTPISEALKKEIINTLLKKSGGIFQWVALQMDHISGLNLEGDIRKRLGQLPKNLEEAYDEIFDRIESAEGSQPGIATRAFSWVLLSFTPLSSDTLVSFVSRDPESGVVEHDDLSIYIVLDACCNLLVIDKRRVSFGSSKSQAVEYADICRLAHSSVQEYLEERFFGDNKSGRLGTAHTGLATVTLQILLERNEYRIKELKLIDQRSLVYAAKFWHQHARKCLESAPSDTVKDMVGMMFQKKYDTAYLNWIWIRYQGRGGQSPGRLFYASAFGFDFVVETLLKEGAKVIRGDKTTSPIVAAGVRCHAGILSQLMHVSQVIDQRDVCDILKDIKGDFTDTMNVLSSQGALGSCGGGQSQEMGKESMERRMIAAARNQKDGDKIVAFLFDRHGVDINVTEAVTKAAASNIEIGHNVMRVLLEKRGSEVRLTESLIKTAASNRGSGDRTMMALLEAHGRDTPITEQMIMQIIEGFSEQVVKYIFDDYGPTIDVKESLVKAVVSNPKDGGKIITMLFAYHGDKLVITQDILRAAAMNREQGHEVIKVLLANCRPDIEITESVLKAAASNLEKGNQVMETLLVGHGFKAQITNTVLKAAASNTNSGDRIVQTILKQRGDLDIPEEIVKAAAKNPKCGYKVIKVLLENKSSKIRITEDVVKAAASNRGCGDKMTETLFDMCGGNIPITENVVEAALSNRGRGTLVMEILHRECGPKVTSTKAWSRVSCG
ncbi:hypothetical protein F1880_001890 [Penicillium rolfsii]|nr:hypothetical protein F1880_001890 [Penicillium rolfsii]